MKRRIGCEEYAESLVAYSAGKLDRAGRAAFDEHLAGCPECREAARGQRAVWEALDGWEAPPVSLEFDRRLWKRIENEASWLERFLRPFDREFVRRGLPIAAVASLALVAAIIVRQPARVTPPRAPSARIEPLRPDQADSALRDMELLQEFNVLLRPDPADSSM